MVSSKSATELSFITTSNAAMNPIVSEKQDWMKSQSGLDE